MYKSCLGYIKIYSRTYLTALLKTKNKNDIYHRKFHKEHVIEIIKIAREQY